MNKQEITKIERVNINKYIKNSGIILIILGLIHLLLPSFLLSFAGIVLILIGIIALVYKNKNMLLIFGILLIIVGVWNILNAISGIFFWVTLGMFQILCGVIEIKKYQYYIKGENKMERITFEELSMPLKTFVVLGWIVISLYGIAFLVEVIKVFLEF